MKLPSRAKAAIPIILLVVVSATTIALLYRVFLHAREIRSSIVRPAVDSDAMIAAIRNPAVKRWASMELPPLEVLYAILQDPEKKNDWAYAVRLIAAHGHSNESSSVLIEYIERGDVFEDRNSPYALALEGSLNAVAALGLTGGEAERDLLLAILRDDRSHDTVSAWFTMIERRARSPYPRSGWIARLRASAALGLLLTEDEASHIEVREMLAALQETRGRGATVEETYLFSELSFAVETVQAADLVGREVLFLDHDYVDLARPLVGRGPN